MKKVILTAAVAALVFGAGNVMADSFTAGTAFNEQGQIQDLGAVNFGANGAISYVNQEQAGIGGSAALPGSAAAEGQIQGENTTVTGTNGFATHSYNTTAVTEGGSIAIGPGLAGHAETQSVVGGIATLGDGAGTASVSGSAMQINQGTIAGGVGFAGGEAGAYANYNSAYTYTNAGTNSVINQSGEQHSVMVTGAGGANAAGAATLTATQFGGTAAINDGNGTAMAGGGAAYGEIKTANGVVSAPGGTAAAGSVGVQNQVHSYEQYSTNGAQTQWATGTVATGNAVFDGVATP